MQPTLEQVAALQAYAKAHGRCWKSQLREAWMTGIYGSGDDSQHLQQVRNNLGPSWLTRYRLPNSTSKAIKQAEVQIHKMSPVFAKTFSRFISADKLSRLSFLNSKDLPSAVVVLRQRRMEWVGIGWVDCGDPRGDEVLVTK